MFKLTRENCCEHTCRLCGQEWMHADTGLSAWSCEARHADLCDECYVVLTTCADCKAELPTRADDECETPRCEACQAVADERAEIARQAAEADAAYERGTYTPPRPLGAFKAREV